MRGDICLVRGEAKEKSHPHTNSKRANIDFLNSDTLKVAFRGGVPRIANRKDVKNFVRGMLAGPTVAQYPVVRDLLIYDELRIDREQLGGSCK